MANLPESATYDAGVYQLELTDPVQGGSTGVSNAPLKNLANRTAWLKSQIDGINNGTIGLALYARLASPTFTGSPAAPTAALGDNTTKLATTAFVQKTLGGVLSKSIAGGVNVTLTAVEAGNGILVFTGALTASISVIVPTAPTRPWVVFNNTTGAFTLTVKTASGTGVAVPQGRREIVYCDGTNVAPAFSDFVDVALEGVPTAPTAATETSTTQVATTAFVNAEIANLGAAPLASPTFTGDPKATTPAQFNDSTSLATTAFVRRHGLAMAGQINLSTSTVLTAASHVGWLVFSNASSAITLTLPLASTVAAGGCIAFQNAGTAALTISRQSSNLIYVGSVGLTTITVQPGEFALLETDGFNWSASGTGVLYLAGSYSRSLSGSGYQRFPGGLIVQWGRIALEANESTVGTITFPIAFPSQCLQVITTVESNSTSNNDAHEAYVITGSLTPTTAQVQFGSSISSWPATNYVRYLAIGY